MTLLSEGFYLPWRAWLTGNMTKTQVGFNLLGEFPSYRPHSQAAYETDRKNALGDELALEGQTGNIRL